ncbi:hypothetical protein LJC11_04430 [Bacteroidales bacterium OttesenSCG-928-I21]|nr:hypothetical protein [Bacteroidales bacterium OttesenSCG-928-I21]
MLTKMSGRNPDPNVFLTKEEAAEIYATKEETILTSENNTLEVVENEDKSKDLSVVYNWYLEFVDEDNTIEIFEISMKEKSSYPYNEDYIIGDWNEGWEN